MRLMPPLIAASIALTACSPTEGDPSADGALASPPEQARGWHSRRVLIGHGELPARVELQAGPAAGITIERDRHWPGISASRYVVQGDATIGDVMRSVRLLGDKVTYVEPDFLRHAVVEDPLRARQWNMDTVGAESAWTWSMGAGVVVAVIDTGVATGGPDGLNAIAPGGYDFVNDDDDPHDDHGHGTHVAGTIAQVSGNGVGVVGLAPGASILPIKVLDANGSGYISDIVSGIELARQQGADVINMSLGSNRGSTSEQLAMQAAYDAGIFVAAAAGNAGTRGCLYPARYTTAVAVGATDFSNDKAPYSNWGPCIELVAPGGRTTVDQDGDGFRDGILQETLINGAWVYRNWQGTSMATPHVAAAAALLMASGADRAQTLSYLQQSALDLGSPGEDDTFGFGLIQPADALAAWDADQGGVAPPPDSAETGDSGTGVTPPPGDTDPPPGDTDPPPGDTDPSCTLSITQAKYNSRRGELTVQAITDDGSWNATLYVDGVSQGAMAWVTKKARYEYKERGWNDQPSLVEVVSECGASDSAIP